MSEHDTNGFIIKDCIAVCPECLAPFFTARLEDSPPVRTNDIIEADLHRVYPDPQIRACLLALCPSCGYCSWVQNFEMHRIAEGAGKSVCTVSPSKKFALAVKSARTKQTHALDVAYLALNGLWCARESGEADNLWLELAAYEHQKGMKEHTAKPEEDGFSHLVMAELWRQLKLFDTAIEEYKLALLDPNIKKEIPQSQITLCQRKQSLPTALPARIALDLFPLSGYIMVGHKEPENEDSTTDDEEEIFVASATEMLTEPKADTALVNQSDFQPEPTQEEPLVTTVQADLANDVTTQSMLANISTSLLAQQVTTKIEEPAVDCKPTPPAFLANYKQNETNIQPAAQPNIAASANPANLANDTTMSQSASHQMNMGGERIEADLGYLSQTNQSEPLPDFGIDDPTTAMLDNAEVVNDRSDVIARVENYLSLSRQLYKRNWLKGFQ